MASPVASGANSATFAVTGDGSFTVADWANLPAGRLSDLLNTVYTDIVLPAPVSAVEQFFADFSAAGGMVSAIGTAAAGCDVSWSCLSGAAPTLAYAINGSSVASVRIALSYSASE